METCEEASLWSGDRSAACVMETGRLYVLGAMHAGEMWVHAGEMYVLGGMHTSCARCYAYIAAAAIEATKLAEVTDSKCVVTKAT